MTADVHPIVHLRLISFIKNANKGFVLFLLYNRLKIVNFAERKIRAGPTLKCQLNVTHNPDHSKDSNRSNYIICRTLGKIFFAKIVVYLLFDYVIIMEFYQLSSYWKKQKKERVERERNMSVLSLIMCQIMVRVMGVNGDGFELVGGLASKWYNKEDVRETITNKGYVTDSFLNTVYFRVLETLKNNLVMIGEETNDNYQYIIMLSIVLTISVVSIVLKFSYDMIMRKRQKKWSRDGGHGNGTMGVTPHVIRPDVSRVHFETVREQFRPVSVPNMRVPMSNATRVPKVSHFLPLPPPSPYSSNSNHKCGGIRCSPYSTVLFPRYQHAPSRPLRSMAPRAPYYSRTNRVIHSPRR